MNHYYLAPWEWVTDDTGSYWRFPAPEHHAGCVDLRSLPQMAKAGGTPEGYGLFAYRQQVTIPGAIYLGADGERARNLTAAAAALGVPSLNANTPGEVAWEMMTTHADPTGQTRCKPLRGDRTHPVRLKIAEQLIKEEPCTGAHLTRTEEVFRADYKRNRQLATEGKLPAEVLQKWVGYTMHALRGVQSNEIARELVPVENRNDDPLWRKPETTITDDFSGGLGAWTVLGGTWTNPSGQIQGENSGSSGRQAIIHDTALSSDEHYCEIRVTASETSTSFLSVCTRVTDRPNGYFAWQRESSALRRIYKNVAGTNTIIRNLDGGGFAPPYTIRLTSDAVDLHTMSINGSGVGSATDTSHTGVLQVALGCEWTTVWGRGDNFEAADLVAALHSRAVGPRASLAGPGGLVA